MLSSDLWVPYAQGPTPYGRLLQAALCDMTTLRSISIVVPTCSGGVPIEATFVNLFEQQYPNVDHGGRWRLNQQQSRGDPEIRGQDYLAGEMDGRQPRAIKNGYARAKGESSTGSVATTRFQGHWRQLAES